MKKKLKILALFDAIAPTTIDQDLSAELKTEDWKTEANVLAALAELGHTTEHLAIFDDLDLLRQKLESFQPDVIFNLADQFKNNRAFDQNIVSFLEMHGVPFTGCGSTGLTLCKHKAISKKILGYHRIRVPEFTVDRARQARHAPGAAQVPHPRQAAEGRGVLRHLAGVVRRDRRAIQGARPVHPRHRTTATSSPRNTSPGASST